MTDRIVTGVAHVGIRQGLHARPGHTLVQVANRFASRIDLTCVETGTQADARSLMDVLLLGAAEGTTLWIRAEGPDADQAVRALQRALDAISDGREFDV
ncbi:MAG: HPr family phosphocarrier protein [Gemmatimonadota bacterium]